MRQRTRAVLAVAAIAVALLAWWLVRAPLSPQPVVQAPDIDIDPPAMRARREAALALALTPDDPWTFAESLAAPGAASAPDPAADKARCGIDERPQFKDPEVRDGVLAVDQTAAAGAHYLAARARMDAALRASTDPFDRAVADWLDVGQMRSSTGRVDALVQQAVATSSAKVYALAFRACLVSGPAPASCAAMSARHWAELDPGNGVPWLYAFDAGRLANDSVAQQEAVAQLAAARRYDDYRFAPAGVLAAHAPADEHDLAAVSDLSVEAIGRSASEVMPLSPLVAVCANQAGGDSARAAQCQAISDAMFDHTDSAILRSMAGMLQFRTTGDNARRDIAHAEQALAARSWSPATGFSECQEERELMKLMLRTAQVGEVEARREQSRKFVTP